MSFITVSLNLSFHDCSVACFDEDKLIFFHQAERFTRTKNSFTFNIDPFEYIFSKITKHIDLLVIGVNRKTNFNVINYIRKKFKIGKVIFTDNPSHEYNTIIAENNINRFTHHTSHAMSAFYMSPFDEAVCLIVDAIGSELTFPDIKNNSEIEVEGFINGFAGNETTSILEISKNYRAKNLYKKVQTLPVTLYKRKEGVFPIAFIGGGLNELAKYLNKSKFVFDVSSHMDIGNMYHTISLHLDFGWNGHGKVMGLSAYGEEDPTLPPFLVNDTIYSNSNLFVPGRELNHLLYPELFGEISISKKANISFALQRSLEKIFLRHAEFIKQNSKIKNLIIGGGCALNILGVSAIKEKYPEFNIFVDPIANDATHAIGEGIHLYNVLRKKCTLEKKNNFDSIYLGPKYDESHMMEQIDEFITNKNQP